MSTAGRSAGNVLTQILLGVVALGLCYYLYVSITEPYNKIKRERAVTEMTRGRMDNVRTALRYYRQANESFPSTIDSLVVFARSNDFLKAKSDSLFGSGFSFDSLAYSPRTGKKFMYAINDTSRVKIYELKDPDSNDAIGTLDPDITKVNAASWE